MSYDILILDDNRAGSTNQSIALAKELNLSYIVKKIDYNILALLPVKFLSFKPLHISKKQLTELITEFSYKFIIIAGRRNASIGMFLKNKYFPGTKLIQIMNPGVNNGKIFDLVVVPYHDHIKIQNTKIIKIIGALCKLDPKPDLIEFEKHYPEVKKFITVLIGGNTKNYRLTIKESLAFCETLKHISLHHHLPFFISFSRRTPLFFKKNIYKYFAAKNIIFDPDTCSYNPYNEILLNGEYIIATNDSISMCSEAASTGNPLYIYCFERFKSKKHLYFIDQLVNLKIVRLLDKSVNYLSKYSYQNLNEVKKVADIIKAEVS